MKTFDLLGFKRAIEDLQNEVNEETGEFINTPDDIQEFINELDGLAEDKIKAIQHVIGLKKAESELNQVEIKAIQETNKVIAKDIIGLNDTMGLLLNGEGLKTNVGSFYYGKESLYIANESQFKKDHPEYIKEVPTIRKDLDKESIKNDIENLEDARLRTGVTFRAKKVKV